MAYTTIDDPSAHFHTQLYSGTGSAQSITNDANAGDFQPDWVWVKKRAGGTARNHTLTDSSRGATKGLFSSLNDAEATNAQGLTSFNSDGFSVGTYNNFNESSGTYVAWQWKANGGSRTTFTESGNNPGGGYQANTTAGFSIIDYTGTANAGTVSHGLGAVPHMIIFKNRDQADDWAVYHHKNTSAPETDFLRLNTTDATIDNVNFMNDTAPTSSVFTVNIAGTVNENNEKYIAYCFTPIQGYSKFGGYTGNGSLDGPFVYLGFKPAWVLIRQTSTAQNWILYDNKINPFNEAVTKLSPNLSDAEDSSTGNNDIDMLSNGFKVTEDNNDMNESGQNFIYMAFAEHPFVSSKGVPVTAR